MLPREKIIVAASGKPGNHGFQHYGARDAVAPAGRPGANGRSSCTATDGSDGQDICVALSRSDKAGTVLVAGERFWKGTNWEVSKDHILLLDCKGGDGGDGGKAEDGQQGGQGARGRDATKHRDAENGQMGARGGDGGYGTNGATGGKAGNIFISVKEDDMDLLLPVYWDIRGGKGGASGTHGDPGDGGVGGNGGSGATWTERYGDRIIERSRPAGAPGPQGPPGARPPTYLAGGAAGANGSSQVKVLRRDGTEATYPTRYELKVVSFDVVDENQDGINEPGEHLFVKNVRVENTGGMPSPKSSEIQVLIHGTHWLDPIASEPIILPQDIPPGATVEVPGVLRAFIMQERAPRKPGQLLYASDGIQLIATATQLQRTLPDFSGSTQITIRYPLELGAPRYLDCVEKGDEVTFSWVLRNVSTKPYGVDGIIQRAAGTSLTDPGHVFDFSDAAESNKHKVVDFLDVLDPGSDVPISQTFKVSELALPYSEGNLKLELLLSEPGRVEALFSPIPTEHGEYPHLRSVVSYAIKLQIAGTYKYNPMSSFLLVVNAQMANNVIHQIAKFIQNELMLSLDIFNLSVGGSFENSATGRSVLDDYQGKSVIISPNTFPYFGKGNISAFDLLDPFSVGRIARTGTNFLLVGPNQNLQTATAWASMLASLTESNHAAKPDSPEAVTQVSASLKELSTTLYAGGAPQFELQLPRHEFLSQKAIFKSPDSKLAGDAKSAALQMNKMFPLRRFTVQGRVEGRTQSSPGTVCLYEGLPLATKIIYSMQDFDPDSEDLADFNKYMIVAALPFKIRTSMFWNMMGSGGTTAGIQSHMLYQGKAENQKVGMTVTVQEQRLVSNKICRAVCLSVEHDLVREFSLFNSKVPWPDVLPGADSLQQLPLLNQFFAVATAATSPIISLEGTGPLSQLLGTLNAALVPVGLGQFLAQTLLVGFGSRKAKLRPQLSTKVDETLSLRFARDTLPQLKAHISAHATTVKAHLKGAGSTRKGLNDLIQKRIAEYSENSSAGVWCTLPLESRSNTEVLARGEADARLKLWADHMEKVNTHQVHAAQVRDEMVTKK